MIPRELILEILSRYDESDIKIGTVCSHSSLQIFNGARREGLQCVGIVLRENKQYYESFPNASPDMFIEVDHYGNLLDNEIQEELISENVILIPHGSFVEYIGGEHILEKFRVPMFGNRLTLYWEGDRRRQREWLEDAGVMLPKIYKSPHDIDRPVIVKLHGAKGGRGYFKASSPEEFYAKFDELKKKNLVNGLQDVLIEEFIAGVRFYPHFFLSPIEEKNMPDLEEGRLELLGIDRRLELIDEIHRGLPNLIEDFMDYTVTGNIPVIVRERYIVDLLKSAIKIVSSSRRLFYPGLIGPFCIETIYNPSRGFIVFEVSARIVAGTNLYTDGSPYSYYYYDEPMSMGRRIAREIKNAIRLGSLHKLIY
ncbi:MAG: 5-formaminoimidazole-4-carboxamide-1-(beta)-D-ribofuranosyl 5'-monophosphate synthetase [Thermoproteota archaeon]|jgi:5-formaminoimidazole-4-carboxamide-1-(beta)-D-ribofuranosyl 5'-monophosphate synthetase|nr:MAG: 5-formaminoimidazole-4-carboxamide-1-(beta)-D-ribofuranosyl 5'-monophosphate synthetase [Candidatus Korarchaeota archaeon]